MTPLLLSHFTATTCLGRGLAPTRAALESVASGLKHCDFETVKLDTWIGEVAGVDAVRAAIGRHGKRRIAVILGTSTSGMLQLELAYRRRDAATGALPEGFSYATTHNAYSVAGFTREYLGLEGPAVVVSTACSSSAKVFAAAARMIRCGLIDAAVVGGVDSLCLTTLYGFSSLELTAPGPCRPYDAGRHGISVGEGAGFALLEPAPATLADDAVLLLGAGESSDAYHMSSPHPDGLGARLAMERALADANLAPADMDYINLHGTATPANDAAEGKAVVALFGTTVPCSSTKGATGHTLGAAGAVEVVACALALQHGFVPGSANTEQVDPAIPVDYLLATRRTEVRHALTNSFGFGGSNCSLVLGRTA